VWGFQYNGWWLESHYRRSGEVTDFCGGGGARISTYGGVMKVEVFNFI
jgi:hypothetical protein